MSCPAIPQGLIETELFGYEKGAFTGAHSTKRGRLEQAHGGTLFLDEVGSLDIGVQSKLLQVLQDGSFMRVGGHETRTIQTRVVSVANRDLRDQVADGSFRSGLPVPHQRSDHPTASAAAADGGYASTGELPGQPSCARCSTSTRRRCRRNAVRLMQKYDWPGNIRQLDNLIRSYVLMGSEDALIAELVEEKKPATTDVANVDVSQPISLKLVTRKATRELERQIILKVLKANNWNRQKTAKWLKISYRSLLYKLNEVGAEDAVDAERRDGPGTKAHRTGLSATNEPTNLIQ